MSLRGVVAWRSNAARVGERLLSPVSVLLTAAQLARGAFKLGQLGWGDAASVSVLLGGIATCALHLHRRARAGASRRLQDEIGLAAGLVAAAYVVVAAAGAAIFPIVYLLVALLVSGLPRRSALALLMVAIALDGAAELGRTGPLSSFAAHAIFLLLFAALYHAVLSARLAAARKAEREAVTRRIKEVEDRARTFRLINAGTQQPQPADGADDKWLMASVKEIEGAVSACLDIAESALRTHTCAAFLLSADDRFLKLYDCRSASEHVQRERFPAGEGILGGVVKRALPIRLSRVEGLRGITYYEGRQPIGSVLAAPIIEGGTILRGVLVADRRGDEPFTDGDEKLLVTIAAEVLRSIEIERVMGYIRKARDEKDRFFRAIEELNRAGSPDQVFLAVLESARLLADLDFCAVTLVQDEVEQRTHRIARVAGGPEAGALEGKCYPDNHGLVATAVRYGSPLPGREITSLDKQLVFDADTRLRGLQALKIFPLLAGDRVLGTLVAGSRRASSLGDDAVRMIEVIAIQAAQAILRAQLFEQMERMAITDSLTGLLNRRAFQAKVDEALAQARRYKHSCSFIIADIDHFKVVNDTYGHAAGDLVLKGVARIIREKARDTDAVARFGGEEFAVAMPQTDSRGAEIIAERIRQTVMKEVFLTELGPLKVTISLGIATYPDHGEAREGLIDLADQSLYDAKRHGRNQSVTVGQMWSRRRSFAQTLSG